MPRSRSASPSGYTFISASRGSSDSYRTAPETPSPFIQALREKGLLLPAREELNWSGRGQHAEFGQSENIPLQTRPYVLPKGGTAVVDVVLCRRIRLTRKTIRCNRSLTIASVLNEVELLQRLRHRHIIRLVGTYLQGQRLALLLYPVADYNLEGFLESIEDGSHNLACIDLIHHCGCLIHALDYIHNNTIKHMDIKPQNILVKQLIDRKNEYRIYIADFGISKSFTDQSQTDGPTPRTPKYCSPEVFNNDRKGRSADIFSMGCVFLEMWTVWANQSLEDFVRFRSDEGDISYHANLSRVILWIDHLQDRIHELNLESSQEEKHLYGLSNLRRMLQKDPHERPSTAELKDVFQSSSCCESGPEPFESESEELLKAAGAGNEATTRRLLESGIEVEARDVDGRTALHRAAEGGHDAVVRILIENKALPNTRVQVHRSPWSRSGWTALHKAAENGHEQVVAELLEKGADPNARIQHRWKAWSQCGLTALHKAAEGGHEKVSRMLIEKGAHVETRDVDGRTALHFAATGGHEAVTRLLIDEGADIEAEDSDGETAQNKANAHGHTSLASLLQKQYPSHTANQSPRSILSRKQITSTSYRDYPSPSANQETSRYSKSLWEHSICGGRDHSPPPEPALPIRDSRPKTPITRPLKYPARTPQTNTASRPTSSRTYRPPSSFRPRPGSDRTVSHPRTAHSRPRTERSAFSPIMEFEPITLVEDRAIINGIGTLQIYIGQHAEFYYHFNAVDERPFSNPDLDNPQLRILKIKRYLAQEILRLIVMSPSRNINLAEIAVKISDDLTPYARPESSQSREDNIHEVCSLADKLWDFISSSPSSSWTFGGWDMLDPHHLVVFPSLLKDGKVVCPAANYPVD